MKFINLVQVTLELWGAFFLAVSYVIVYLGQEENRRKGILLRTILGINIALLINDALAYVYTGAETRAGSFMLRLSHFLLFFAIPAIAYAVFLYMRELLSDSGYRPHPGWTHTLRTICALNCSYVCISQFTNWIYYFDEQNIYYRAGGYWVVAAFGIVLVLFMVSLLWRYRDGLSEKEFTSLLSYVALPFISNIIQFFYYGLSLNSIAITIGILMIFLTHEVEKSKRIIHQENLLMQKEIDMATQQSRLSQLASEVREKQTRITISQMQPHFIFNALGSIEQLCKIDPKKAAEATHHFAQYLRSNLNALSSTEQVSFRKELEHVRTYVWLEKMRFGDDLVFVEDIGADNFTLPCLTIQPLVENAIKHGMMGDTEVLTVTLTTRETGSLYEIVVQDDGAGFDPREEIDSTAHVGLNNVRERIHLISIGSLTVDSAVGRGTTVTIRIPK